MTWNIRGWDPDKPNWGRGNNYRDEGPCLTDNVTTLNDPNITYLTNIDHATALLLRLTGGWELTLGKLFGKFNTLSPTPSPTPAPTNATYSPSVSPSNFPSINPTISPSLSPSLPTISPSPEPTNSPTRDPWTGILDYDDVLWEGSLDHFGTLNNNGRTVMKLGINTTYSTMRKIGPINASNHRNLYFVYKFRCNYYDESYSYMKIAASSESNQQYATYIESAKGWDRDSDSMTGPCIDNPMQTIDYPNITYFDFWYDNIDTFYLGLSGGWELVYGKLFGTGQSSTPTRSPTPAPSNNPTTAEPSRTPTTDDPTSAPTMPSHSPSSSPTDLTMGPTINPTMSPTRDRWTGISANDHVFWEGSLDHFGLYKSGSPVQKMGVDTSYSNLRKIRIDDTRDYIGFYFVYSFSCDYFNANYSWMEISAAPRNAGNSFPSALESVNGWIDANATNGYCIDTPNVVINEPNVTFLGDRYDNLDYFYLGLKGGWQLVYGKLFGTYHTLSPTLSPTISPTPEPTNETYSPSVSPSDVPTAIPTMTPTNTTSTPTMAPTMTPTMAPSYKPITEKPITVKPTPHPTKSDSKSSGSSITDIGDSTPNNDNELTLIIIFGAIIIFILVVCILYMLLCK